MLIIHIDSVRVRAFHLHAYDFRKSARASRNNNRFMGSKPSKCEKNYILLSFRAKMRIGLTPSTRFFSTGNGAPIIWLAMISAAKLVVERP